ncbi:hypothetical protein LCGC14_1864860, partial [marine sediment metagenome]
ANSQDNETLIEFLEYFLREECGLGKVTSRKIAAQFNDLESFINFNFQAFKSLRGADEKKLVWGFNDDHVSKIAKKIKLINRILSVSRNFQQSIGRKFLSKIILNLRNIELDQLRPNPFLIKLMNLNKVDDIIQFIIFQRADRSIVTSFGTCLEFLVSASGAEKLARGFDVLKIKDNEKHYIQVKSGTSDMDKDQIESWGENIEQIENEGHHGYIGMCYGRRDDPKAISLNLMKAYLPEWERKTLVGKELWEFVSDDETYHEIVLKSLEEAAKQILENRSILDEIESAAEKLILEFQSKFGENIEDYIKTIF